jgi:hypothetical protein
MKAKKAAQCFKPCCGSGYGLFAEFRSDQGFCDQNGKNSAIKEFQAAE